MTDTETDMTKVDDVIKAFIALRDKKDEITRGHKEELAPINEKLATCEAWLQRHLLAEGVESMKTGQGTAFLSRATSATVKDWPVTLQWIKDNDEWSMLDARVNKTAVKSYLEENNDVPPGVNYSETVVTRVRRK